MKSVVPGEHVVRLPRNSIGKGISLIISYTYISDIFCTPFPIMPSKTQ
jgi:hypothetical protein